MTKICKLHLVYSDGKISTHECTKEDVLLAYGKNMAVACHLAQVILSRPGAPDRYIKRSSQIGETA